MTKIWGFHTLCKFLAEKEGILKTSPRVPKLQLWLLGGLGRCLKLTLQARAPKDFHSVEGLACVDLVARTPSAWAEIQFVVYRICYLTLGCQHLSNNWSSTQSTVIAVPGLMFHIYMNVTVLNIKQPGNAMCMLRTKSWLALHLPNSISTLMIKFSSSFARLAEFTSTSILVRPPNKESSRAFN